jgi:hypothetical protein
MRRGKEKEIVSRLPDHLQPPAIKIAVQRMICTGCGAEMNAACNCGKAYVPVAQRVAEYDKANPGQSTRQAAADLGVHHSTVNEARKAAVGQPTPDTVTGRDGKSYPASRPPPEPRKPPTAAEQMRVPKTAADGVWNKAWQAAELLKGIAYVVGGGVQPHFSPLLTEARRPWLRLSFVLRRGGRTGRFLAHYVTSSGWDRQQNKGFSGSGSVLVCFVM